MRKIYLKLFAICLTGSTLFAQVPAFVSTDSLQGYWNFNGNLDNALSTGLTLTPGGTVSYAIDRNGSANSSLNNGEAYKTSIDGFDATTGFTIGGWVSPYLVQFSPNPSNYIGYFYKMDYEVMQQIGGPSVGTHTQFAFLSDFVSTGPGITGFGPDYGKLYFQTVIGGTTRILKSAVNFNSNVWYHVMVSYDQSYLRLYVNGDCTDSLAVTGNLDYSNATGNNEWAGFTTYLNHNPSQNIESRTTLDQMGFWRRALQPCEVLNLFEESTANCGPVGIDAPTNLTAAWTTGTTEVVLNWTDNSANESGFAIQRSTDGVNFTNLTNVAADVLTYTDNTVIANTTYYYRVFAFNAVEDSDFSNVAQVTTGTAGLSDASASFIRYYPNPAKEQMTVEGLSGSESIVLTSITGEIVLERATLQETIQLDLSGLASGTYFLRAGNRVPVKINVQH